MTIARTSAQEDAKRVWRLRRKIRWLFLGWFLFFFFSFNYGRAFLFLGLKSISDKNVSTFDLIKVSDRTWIVAVVATFVLTIFAGIMERRARLRFKNQKGA